MVICQQKNGQKKQRDRKRFVHTAHRGNVNNDRKTAEKMQIGMQK